MIAGITLTERAGGSAWQGLRELFARAPSVVVDELGVAVDTGNMLLLGHLQSVLPKGAGGQAGSGLVGSVFVERESSDDGVTGTTASSSPYATYLELGTRPHTNGPPPIAPILAWVEARLNLDGEEAESAAHAIAWHRMHYGAPAVPYWRDALDLNREQIAAYVGVGIDRALARVAQADA